MKDDSLPYVYLDDEDEPKAKKKSKAASAQRSGKAQKELPYVYLDDDAPKAKKRAPQTEFGRSVSAARKTAKTAPARVSAQAKSSKSSKSTKSSNGAVTGVTVAALSIIALLGIVAVLDWVGVVNIGIKAWLTGDESGKNNNSAVSAVTPDPSAVNVSWFTPDGGDDDGLDQNARGSVVTTDLNINPNLNPDWENILLLGTDSRVPHEPSRTDTMMICSVNRITGAVKLTSIMRDTAVEIQGKTQRINSAYFFGGADLAMSTVNKYFGLNIQKYVIVNFSGFADIVDALGGVEMNVTDRELGYLNHNVAEQYYLQFRYGGMSEEEARQRYHDTKLEAAGMNIHLDGMQALGYARIRKADSDYGRTERQRNVLNALLTKMKGTDAGTIMNLAYANIGHVTTNMAPTEIAMYAANVLNSDFKDGMKDFRVPFQNTYKEETRNNVSMLYDMDVQENKRQLYQFIYGQ